MSFKEYVKRGLKYIIYGVPETHLMVHVEQVAPDNILKNRRIIITGGGRGLGYSIAEMCISEGAEVLIAGRNEETLKKASGTLGENCKYLVFDVQDIGNINKFYEEATRLMGGKIDSLVSNAGISLHEKSFRNVSEEGWDIQFNTNLKGNYFIVKTFVEYLEKFENRKGTIVVISSERAKRSDDIPYGLTKIATNSFIQSIGKKVISEGIRINGVGPGVTTSDMTGFSKNDNLYASNHPGKRIFVPEEVAEVVKFLLSDSSACIAGEVITCDQGLYISDWNY